MVAYIELLCRYLASQTLGNAVAPEPIQAMALQRLSGDNDGPMPDQTELETLIHTELQACGVKAGLGNVRGKSAADPLRQAVRDQAGRLFDETLRVLQQAGIICGQGSSRASGRPTRCGNSVRACPSKSSRTVLRAP